MIKLIPQFAFQFPNSVSYENHPYILTHKSSLSKSHDSERLREYSSNSMDVAVHQYILHGYYTYTTIQLYGLNS